MNIYIENYGCSANLNNGELMAGLLEQSGFIIVNNEKLADLIVLNTCVVKGPTLNRMIGRIREVKKPLVIAGCLAEVSTLVDTNASLVGPRNVKDIVNVVKHTLQGNNIEAVNGSEVKLNLPRVMKNKVVGIVQIADGCLGNCTYCLPKHAKKNLFSYPKEEIVKEVKRCVEHGCKEIWLTSQDNGCYGIDINETLPSLLKEVAKVKGRFIVRLGMANPNFIKDYIDDLIKVLKDDKFFKFIHIPVQSGSNKVLKDMNRKYKAEEFIQIVERLRKSIPNICIASDIIFGFPTETEHDFKQTLDLVKKVKPDIINISRYWPMKLTPAASLKQVDDKTVKARIKQFNEIYNTYSLENNKKFIGKEGKALINEGTKGNWLGRTRFYKQVAIKTDEPLLGKSVNFKVTGAHVYGIKGVAKRL
jgi:MiaB-like tRNA modifying enzyme